MNHTKTKTNGCADCGKHSWYLFRRGICGTCCNAEDARIERFAAFASRA